MEKGVGFLERKRIRAWHGGLIIREVAVVGRWQVEDQQ